MKKIVSVFLFVLFLGLYMPTLAAPIDSAESAVIMDGATGAVLYEKNADQQMLIASTTKIMTALVVLENCDISEKVTIPEKCTNIEGSSIYLKTGEVFSVEELLYGMMLASGNDAAEALAYHTAGGTEEFAMMMNEKAEELGLSNTSFKNPHGLDAVGHYSSARDMAVIAVEAMKNSDFAKIVSTKSTVVHERVLVNHNKLLWRYDGALGIKTGYTKKSGRSLVSCVKRGNFEVVCVTINDRDDWDDHISAYNWVFENYKSETVISSETMYDVPVISGIRAVATCAVDNDVILLLKAEDKVRTQILLPKFMFAPIFKGDKVGSVEVYLNDELYGIYDIVCIEGIEYSEENELSFWEKLMKNIALK